MAKSQSTREKPSVLFVCLGNICRSPMAEAVFKHVVKERGLEERLGAINSAGTAGYHVGEKPDPRSTATCVSHGVPVHHFAQQVSKNHFRDFDWILCMDESNLADLKRKQPPGSTSKVQLFGEFDPKGDKIIKDPYYGGIDGFEYNYRQVVRCSEGFLKHLDMI
ncbi:acid phosphatase [Spizellomyces sp. 'palustris']|nr:acid phosphatase [Spizellomyces sp. 'palustris']